MADTDRELLELLLQAKGSQPTARPNPIQAMGAGMAGFAAPFIGQTWKNPYPGPFVDSAQGVRPPVIDPGNLPTSSGIKPSVEEIAKIQTSSPSDMSGLAKYLSPDQPPSLSPSDILIKKQLGYSTDPMFDVELYRKGKEEKQKKDIALTYEQQQKLAEARSVNQSVQLATSMFADGLVDVVRSTDNTIKEKFGVKLDPSRGLEGKAFAFLNKALGKAGYNSYFDSMAKGMTNELAAEFAKAGGASRLGFFILNAFRETIPKLGEDTVESGGFQLIKSSVNAYRKYVKEAYDEDFDISDKRVKDFEAKTTESILKRFEDAGIYKPKIYQFKTKDMKTPVRMPEYMVKFWARDNGVSLKDIDEVKFLFTEKEGGM